MGNGNLRTGTAIGTAEIKLKIRAYQASHEIWSFPNTLQEEDIVIGYDIIGERGIIGKISRGNIIV